MDATVLHRSISIEWTERDGYRFPSVGLGDLRWKAWHSVGEKTAWVDGALWAGDDTHLFGLDIAALGSDYEFFEMEDMDMDLYRARATQAWSRGTVFTENMEGVTVLYTPLVSLEGDALAHALSRFRP